MSKWRTNVLLATMVAGAFAQLGFGQTLAEIENPKVDAVAEKMNCPCGCKLNMACKMEPWPCQTCRKAKIKIVSMQAQGKSEKEIIDTFAAEGVEKVVPPGIIGSALSYSALALGLGLVILVIRRYRRPVAAPAGGVDPALLAKIEKDTANLD